MKQPLQAFHALCSVGFIAMKVGGLAWSWWWLLMPAVPVLTEAFHLAQRKGIVK